MSTDSFRNWQARSIEQRQASSTVMLGLSGGALAFSASLLDGQNCYIGYSTSVLFHFHGALQILAMGAGVWFTVNRSRDFALTASIARIRGKNAKDSKLPVLRAKVRKLGTISRRLLFTQGILFLSAAALFIALVMVRYSHVLYPPASF
jgi:hypothetical protein